MRTVLSLATLTLIAALGLMAPVAAEELDPKKPRGTIKGTVVDAVSQQPLVGASVLLVGYETGASAKADGSFTLERLPVGTYALTFRCVGYEAVTQTDVIVRSGRITRVESELRPIAVEVGNIVVSAGYFTPDEEQTTSATSFDFEEVRRSPGSAGDVSRIMMVLPSVAKVDDQLNSLVVRGGSPSENAFYLDNIEIPNINHYPLQGTSGGPIGLLNTDFIERVDFSAGGFPASYGDRLSSVMNLQFREGSRDEHDFQIDLNMAGFGVIGEGPLFSRRGSWMFSGRRSYLDLLVEAIATGVTPKYSDWQGKLVYDLSSRSRISALGVAGFDYISWDKSESSESGIMFYGHSDGYEYAGGINWRYLWGDNAYSNTSFSYQATNYKAIIIETTSDRLLANQNSIEGSWQVRNVNHYRLAERSTAEFGFDAKYVVADHDYHLAAYTNAIGNPLPALTVKENVGSPQIGVFASHTYRPWSRLALTTGLRYDYYDYVDRAHLSPRLSASYDITPRTTLMGAAGVYRQYIPLSLLTQKPAFRELKDPIAYHYVLGLSHLLRDDTRLTVEAYYKWYDNFPMDPGQPQLFVADELGFARMIGDFPELQSGGQAYAAGIEATLQKKLVRGIYGLVSASFFRTRYRGLDGHWRDRLFDNRILFTVEGGYKPNEKWEYSLRWVFAGGHPITPLNLATSRAINRSVDDSRRVNEDRIPAYHSLNLRVDRRFNFSGSNLIVFFSVWNAYNRKNVSQYYWNEIDRKEEVLYQWSLLPVGGFEFEF